MGGWDAGWVVGWVVGVENEVIANSAPNWISRISYMSMIYKKAEISKVPQSPTEILNIWVFAKVNSNFNFNYNLS